MNLQHADPPLPLHPIPKLFLHLPSFLHAPRPPPVTLFHWCVHMSVRVYSCKARGAANTGQRLIFVARPVCILTARRRLGGQLLLQLHSLTLGSLQRVFANSHCLLISRSSRTKLSFKHSLKMTGCICGARQVEDNEEGKKGDRYPNLETLGGGGGRGWVDDKKS